MENYIKPYQLSTVYYLYGPISPKINLEQLYSIYYTLFYFIVLVKLA